MKFPPAFNAGPSGPPLLDLSTLTLDYWYDAADYVYVNSVTNPTWPGRASAGSSGSAAKVLTTAANPGPDVSGPTLNGVPLVHFDRVVTGFVPLQETTPATLPNGGVFTWAWVGQWLDFAGSPANDKDHAFNNSGFFGDAGQHRFNLSFRNGFVQQGLFIGSFAGVEVAYTQGTIAIIMGRCDGVGTQEIRVGGGAWTTDVGGAFSTSVAPKMGRSTNNVLFNGDAGTFLADYGHRYDDATCDAIFASLKHRWGL